MDNDTLYKSIKSYLGANYNENAQKILEHGRGNILFIVIN